MLGSLRRNAADASRCRNPKGRGDNRRIAASLVIVISLHDMYSSDLLALLGSRLVATTGGFEIVS